MKDLSKVKSILASVRAKGNLFSPKVLAVGAAALGLSGALSFVAPFRGVAEATAKQTLYGASGGSQYLDGNGKATTADKAVVEANAQSVDVTVKGGTKDYAKIGNGSSTGVQLTITGGTWADVFGGFGSSDGKGNCKDNVVTIGGTAVIEGNIYLAYILTSAGDPNETFNYANNTLNIQGGTIGSSNKGSILACPTEATKKSNNVIHWSGGTIASKTIKGDEIIITDGTFSGGKTYNMSADDKYVQLGDKEKSTTGTLTIAAGTLKIDDGVDYVNGSTISIGSGATFYIGNTKDEWKLDGKSYRWFDGGVDKGSKYFSSAKKTDSHWRRHCEQ